MFEKMGIKIFIGTTSLPNLLIKQMSSRLDVKDYQTDWHGSIFQRSYTRLYVYYNP